MAGGGDGVTVIKLEFTPTWIVAVVCSVMVFISLVVERILHSFGKVLKRKNQKPLFEALQKIKEELMLMGFISLILVVFQGVIQRVCIPVSLTRNMLPCDKEDQLKDSSKAAAPTARFPGGGNRRLLVTGGGGSTFCTDQGKIPLLSLEAITELHIFIFVLAITHVVLSALTMLLSGAKTQQWKSWEDSIQNREKVNDPKLVTPVDQVEFIKERFQGFGRDSKMLGWSTSFIKQFYGSLTKSDYTTLRLGFIMTHCKGNPGFNFYKYMVRSTEADYKKVVGISWYLWLFVVIFLLLNVEGWRIYFWMSFIPLIILLVVGTKLEHVITRLAHDVAEKHTAIEGDLVIKPSDFHFWFHRPKIILYLVHFILFQNAFEISFFFWILVTYGMDSCIMGQVGFLVPRVIISAITQLLCSYSTLPLYAIVTQMGSSFKKSIFDEHVQDVIMDWANKVKKKKGQNTGNGGSRSNAVELRNPSPMEILLQSVVVQGGSRVEEEKHEPIVANGSDNQEEERHEPIVANGSDNQEEERHEPIIANGSNNQLPNVP